MLKRYAFLPLCPLLLLLVGAGPPAAATPAVFDTALERLQVPATDGAWRDQVAAVRRDLGPSPTPGRVRLALNTLFAERETEGKGLAHLYASDEAIYWTLASCFGTKLADSPVHHIGAWFERHGKRWFVRDVLPASPAAAAGLVRGDEIVSVASTGSDKAGPLAPIASFAAGTSVVVRFRRLPWEEPRRVVVTIAFSSLPEALLKGVHDSYFVRNVKGKHIAYVRLPSSCRPDFEDALLASAKTAQIDADAMVLDLRGDFGPGGLTYLTPFFAVPAAGDSAATPLGIAPYGKPLVVLVDAGTSGGREELAAFLQSQQRAILVGARTAGATSPGRATELEPNTSLLWLAPKPAPPPLTPDLPVEDSLLYAAGADPQLAQALTAAAAK